MIKQKRWTIRRADLPVLLLAALCICCLSLHVQRTVGIAFIALLWLMYWFLENYDLLHIKTLESITLMLSVVYLVVCVIYRYVGLSDAGTGITTTFLFFLPYFAILPIYYKLEDRQCRFLLAVCMATVLYSLWENFDLWLRLGTVPMHMYLEGYSQVVNTQYVSAVMLLSGITFCGFLRSKGKLRRTAYLGMTGICFLFNVLVTQRAIMILLTFVMLPLLLMFNGKSGDRRVIRSLLMITVLIVGLLGYRVILTGISELLGSPRLAERLNSIIALLDSSELSTMETGSLTVRLQLIRRSIHTFFESLPNFLIGVGDQSDVMRVGGHGQFFDEFARYGIFGGLLSNGLLVATLCTMAKFVALPKSSILYRQMLVIFATFYVRGMIGAIYAPSIGAVMFIILPITFRLLSKADENCLQEVQIL